MSSGNLYIADDPGLAADMRHGATLTHRLNSSDPSHAQARIAALRELVG
jgi:maltose O-acetyltransferase